MINCSIYLNKKTKQNSLPISLCPQPLATTNLSLVLFGASFVAQLVKNPPAMWETWAQSLDREDTLEKEMVTHSSFTEESHAQRNLAGYSPWGRKELDTTEAT